ncbi:hypothetical protein BK126_21435 [Paenibacillus sp. FSL H7-0326]|uniref:ABC transporter ATP-binding protein n=1 Tax=Paenibacillus sp. FSL H7-0326 TaxID=1921144 RepID=UPI00096EAD94|nr:ABC transporter ATP-binding protein [Paenibacillus sp. FSL H7-0326]OMC66561.1 hypothetical protein BK126_21435 [Paenibacillus sp. FSL H7-0326]
MVAPIIKVNNLSKVYKIYEKNTDRIKEALLPKSRNKHREFFALNNVSFEVSRGEIIGIVGKNGSGKSTLLKIITGVLQPTSGEISVLGKVSALLELGAGFNPEYSGMENVYLNGTIMGYTRQEVDQRLDAILSFADIGDFIHQPVKTYSSGMFARLAFAVAINVEPEVLIVDEALSVGDAAFQAKCMKRMKSLMKSGTTILLVSHDTGTMKSMCSRVVYLNQGEVIDIGDAGEVCDRYIQDLRSREGMFTLKDNLPNEKEPSTSISLQENTSFYSEKEKIQFDKAVINNRTGTGEVLINFCGLYNELGVASAEFGFDDLIRLRIEYLAVDDINNLVIGIHVRDKNQMEIIGTNTFYEGVSISQKVSGERGYVEFSFKNRLREGNYSFTILVVDQIPTNLFYDRIDHVCFFKSKDPIGQTRWALVSYPMEVSLEEINGG